MTEFWQSWQGTQLNAYALGECVSASSRQALYFIQTVDQRPAAMKVILMDEAEARLWLARWLRVAELSHPNLMPVLDAGQGVIGDRHVAYVVTERADDDLGHVIPGRALNANEVGDVAAACASALEHLHGHGFLHARLQPSNVMAIGETVKISSDGVRFLQERSYRPAVRGPYDPPEAELSPAGDVWSLGALLVEALTQKSPPKDLRQLKGLPQPFDEITRGALEPDPAARWTMRQVTARLRGEPVAAPTTVSPKTLRRYGVAAAALTILAGVLVFGTRHAPVEPGPRSGAVQASVPQIRRDESANRLLKPAPAVAPPEPAVPAARKPSPMAGPRPITRGGAKAWALVAATYARQEDAEKRAASIARQWPNFRPEVYDSDGRKLVILGRDLTQDQAAEMQRSARETGLPSDTYITKLSR